MKSWIYSSIELQLVFAIIIDLIIGDPPKLPHLVINYGNFLKLLEQKLNKNNYRIIKGALGVSVFILLVYIFNCLLNILKGYLPLTITIISIWLMASCLAIKSLADHAFAVYKELNNNNLIQARLFTSYIVGRDTQNLNEAELTRAVVETVAENTVDGVTAPLFYLLCFGLPGGLIYKAINTLDSMWGHKNDRFIKFGKVAARLDDIANFIPARLTAITIIIVSFLWPNYSGKQSLKIVLRDRYKHPSPNSGLSESAFAGSLKVQLGGTNYYQGSVSHRGKTGDKLQPLTKQHIKMSINLMKITSLLFAVLGLTIRVVL